MRPPALEAELERGLKDTWCRGTDGVAEGRAANVAIDRRGAIELCVVEDVESLDMEEQCFRLCQREVLGRSHVVVVRTGTVEEAALRRPRSTECIHREGRGREVVFVVGPGIAAEVQRPTVVIGLVDAAVVDAVRVGAQQ